jgi:Fe-S oxidoreductase
MQPTRHEFLFFDHWWEKPLFYVLIFASLAYMAYQVLDRVRLWKLGRPLEARSGEWKHWVANIWKFVMLQKKVRSSRPKSGAPMHLLIFYGFFSLFVATSLLAIATYGPYNFHHGTYYLIYEVTFDFLGLLFIVGAGWALVRRAILLSRARSGVHVPENTDLTDLLTLGLLLALGLTGYWLEAARISALPQSWDRVSFVGYWWAHQQGPISPLAYKAIWWFHAAWVMVFFAVLPKMRIRHVLMAILTTAGERPKPMGELRTIPIEEVEQTEQIGVKLAKDYSRWNLMSLDACMECGRCTEVCPAWNVGKVLNPRQVVQDIRTAMKSGEEVAPRISEEALWACTTCNACVEACPVLIRHVDLIVDVRRNIVSEGALSGSAATMLRQTAGTGSAWGQSASNREDWMKDLEIPLCRDGVEFDVLFWVGCAGATDPGAIKTTKAVAALLKKAGVKFACLGKEEACTGDPARRVGEEFLFQDKATQNCSVFEKYGVTEVVTHCPHCFNTFKNEYGAFGAQIEVFHHTQYLQTLVRKGDLLAARTPGTTVLHDPCYLARVNGESDAPRAIAPGIAEPERHGKKTLCCGAGGGRMFMDEAPNMRPSVRRTEELLATGADTIAVACPFCRIMLGDSLKQVRPNEEIRLVDLAEMLQEANG